MTRKRTPRPLEPSKTTKPDGLQAWWRGTPTPARNTAPPEVAKAGAPPARPSAWLRGRMGGGMDRQEKKRHFAQ